MPSSDREVYRYFEANVDTAREIDYLAYAAFAVAKFDWFDKFATTQARAPTQDEVDAWISQLPDSRLDEIHDAAGQVFRTAAREYMAERMERAAQKAVRDSVHAEIARHNKQIEEFVRSATSFSRNLIPNVGIGIISAFIFSVIIIIASLIFTRDPSPLALYKSIDRSDSPAGSQGQSK